MSEPVLQFTDDMRRENIKSLSWYLLKKYLEGGNRCPVLLKILTDYVNECEVAGDCFMFVKMLSLLILSEQAEPEEEGTKLVVIKSIYDTLVELKQQCGKQLEESQKKLDQLIAEARCQVIVSHLMYDDVDSALLHWRDFYADKNFAEDPLGSQLHQILNYLSEDSYRKKRDEAMNLSINLFFTEHELKGLGKDVRSFVERCCGNILQAPKTIMKYNLRSTASRSLRSTARAEPPASTNTAAVMSRPATRSTQTGSSRNQGDMVQTTPTTTDAELSSHTPSPEKRKKPANKTPPKTPPLRKRLSRNAKRKPAKTAVDTSEFDFTTSSEDEDLILQPDIALEATPTSKLPARLAPVHFKRAYLTAGNSKLSASKSSPKRPFAAFRRPQKKKVKFSTQETEYLMAGIKRYGYGNWAVILSKYPFHPTRDKVSLKDKARNLRGR